MEQVAASAASQRTLRFQHRNLRWRKRNKVMYLRFQHRNLRWCKTSKKPADFTLVLRNCLQGGGSVVDDMHPVDGVKPSPGSDALLTPPVPRSKQASAMEHCKFLAFSTPQSEVAQEEQCDILAFSTPQSKVAQDIQESRTLRIPCVFNTAI